jgi:hypothetical protein
MKLTCLFGSACVFTIYSSFVGQMFSETLHSMVLVYT